MPIRSATNDIDPGRPRRAAGILIMTASSPRRFLLLRHADRWDLPKGHCDPGETDRQTALRETQEETGIAAADLCLDPEFRFECRYAVRYGDENAPPVQKRVTYFLGFVAKEFTPVLTEHLDHRWFDWDPPHHIQVQTIDPLLAAIADHGFDGSS